MSLAGFNPMDVDPASDREPIPEGVYEVMIAETEWKENSKGTGRYLNLTLQVISGEHDGRLIWEMLNLDNPNAQAVEIAMKTLSAICRACGHTDPLTTDDGSELHNRPMQVKVGIDPPKGQYNAKNRIRAWLPKDSAPAASKATAKSAATPAASGKRTPPWGK